MTRPIKSALCFAMLIAVGCSDAEYPAPTSTSTCPRHPANGAPCTGEQRCLYSSEGKLDAGEFKCSMQEYVCRDGSYQSTGLHCDPIAPSACPATQPAPGTDCVGSATCFYDSDGKLDAGEFNCALQEYVCREGSYENTGRHCDPIEPSCEREIVALDYVCQLPTANCKNPGDPLKSADYVCTESKPTPQPSANGIAYIYEYRIGCGLANWKRFWPATPNFSSTWDVDASELIGAHFYDDQAIAGQCGSHDVAAGEQFECASAAVYYCMQQI